MRERTGGKFSAVCQRYLDAGGLCPPRSVTIEQSTRVACCGRADFTTNALTQKRRWNRRKIRVELSAFLGSRPDTALGRQTYLLDVELLDQIQHRDHVLILDFVRTLHHHT